MGIKILGLLLAVVAGAAYGRPGYGSISLGIGQGGVKGNAGFGYSGTKTLGSGARGYVDISTNDLGGNAELHGSGNQIAGVTDNSDLLGAVNGNLGSNHVNGEAHSVADAGIGGSSHFNRDNSVLAINLGGYGANSNASSDSNVAGHNGESNVLGDGDRHGFLNNVHEAIHIGHIHGTRGSNGGEVGVSHGSNSVLGLTLGGNANEVENGASGRGGNVGHTNQEASRLNLGGNGILNAHSYGRRDQSAGDTGSSGVLGVVNGSFRSSTDGYQDNVAHSVTQGASHGSNSVLGGHGSGRNVLTGISLGANGANRNGSSETHANVDVGHSGGSNLFGDVSLTGHGDHSHGSVGNEVQGAGHEVSHGSNSVLGLTLGGNANEVENGASGRGGNVGHTNQEASRLNLGGNGILNAHSYGRRDQSAGDTGSSGVLGVVNGSFRSSTDGYHDNVAHSVTQGASHGSNSVLGGHGSGRNVLTGISLGANGANRNGSSETHANVDVGHSGGSNLFGDVSLTGHGDHSHGSVGNEVQGAGHEVSHGSNSVVGLGLGGNTNGAANGEGGHGSSQSGNSILGFNLAHNNQASGVNLGENGNEHSSVTIRYNAVATQEGSQGAENLFLTRPYIDQGNHVHGLSGRGPYRGHSYPSSSGLGTHSQHSYPSSSGLGTHSQHSYPSSSEFGTHSHHSYPSSSGLGTHSQHSYPSSSGLGTHSQHSYLSSSGLGTHTQQSYPSTSEFGTHSHHSYPSSSGLGTHSQHSYPSSSRLGTHTQQSYPSTSEFGTHSHHSYPSSSGLGTHSQNSYPSSSGYGSHTYPPTGGISTLDNTYASNGVSGNAHPSNHEITGSLSQVSHGNHSVLGLILGGERNEAENGESSQGSSPSGHSVLRLNVGHNDQETSGLHFGRNGNQHSSGTSGNHAIATQEGSQGAAQADFYRRYDTQSPYGNRIPYSSTLYHLSTTKLPPFGNQVHGNGGYSTPSPQGTQVYPTKGGISTSDNPFASNGGDNGYVPVTGHSHGCFSYPLPRNGNSSDWYGSSDHAYQAGQGGIRFSNSPGFTSHGYGSSGKAYPAGQGGISGSFSNSPGYGSHGHSYSSSVNAGHGE